MEQSINPRDLHRALTEISRKMVTKDELEWALETITVLSNPRTMRQIAASEADIRAGRIKEIRSVHNL